MADDSLYSSMGSNSPKELSLSPRSNYRTMASASTPELTRFSRSQTMVAPVSSVTSGSRSPSSPYKNRSSTHIGHQASSKYLTRNTPNEFLHLDHQLPPQGSSRTLSHLHRSKTTKPSPVSSYGKSMWEEDEYVQTGVSSPTRPQAGGAAARRINQQRKMQTQTINLPKNPFIDPETTDDYADMTGHMNDKSGMNELRQAHQYKSLTTRGHAATLRPPIGEVETDGMNREFDMGTTRERNLSMGSSRSGSDATRFRRCDTSPALALRTQDSCDGISDLPRNGSVRSAQHPALEEIDGKIESPSRMKDTMTSHTMYIDRHNSDSTSKMVVSRTMSSTMKPQLSAPSPDHSIASKETANTYLPQSPATPSVIYKNNDNMLEPNVAIVIEETGPTSPMYGAFSTDDSQKSKNGATLKDTSEKRELKFESAPPTDTNCKFIIPLIIAVLIIIGLAVGVALLAITSSQQAKEINHLKEQLSQIMSQTTSASVLVLTTAGENTPNVTTTTPQPETTTTPTKYTTATDSLELTEAQTSHSTPTGNQEITETKTSNSTPTGNQEFTETKTSNSTPTGNQEFTETKTFFPTIIPSEVYQNKSTLTAELSTAYTTAAGTQQTAKVTNTSSISTSSGTQTTQAATAGTSVETVQPETTVFMNTTA